MLSGELLSRYLPSAVTGGRPRRDDRLVVNGIVWKVRSGAPWRDLPERYGAWQSVYTRFRRWALDGTFARMLAGVHADADAVGDIQWLVSVDSTIVRAHQHAAGGGKGGSKNPANWTQGRNRLTPSDDLEADQSHP